MVLMDQKLETHEIWKAERKAGDNALAEPGNSRP